MLQRMQAKGGVDTGFAGAVNAKNGALFMQMIIVKWVVWCESWFASGGEWYRVTEY